MMHVLVSPALAENGKALWEKFFPPDLLKKLRKEMGTLIFNLQFQNDARLAGGAVFRPEWLRKHESVPRGGKTFTGVDLAVSQKPGADYFAAVTVKYDGENFYVVDARRARCSFLSQVEIVKRVAHDFRPAKIGVEAVAYQAAFASYLAETGSLPVVPVHPRGDKVSRAYRLSPLAEAGRLFLGMNQHELEQEMVEFPDGAHDDLVDALEIAVGLARKPFRQKFARVAGI